MAGSVRIHGIKQLEQALKEAESDTHARLRDALREAADVVTEDARGRFTAIDARSAAGFRPRVRVGRAVVEQKLRRTTGDHPGYGSMQLAVALIPALEAKEGDVVARMERALDMVAREFN